MQYMTEEAPDKLSEIDARLSWARDLSSSDVEKVKRNVLNRRTGKYEERDHVYVTFLSINWTRIIGVLGLGRFGYYTLQVFQFSLTTDYWLLLLIIIMTHDYIYLITLTWSSRVLLWGAEWRTLACSSCSSNASGFCRTPEVEVHFQMHKEMVKGTKQTASMVSTKSNAPEEADCLFRSLELMNSPHSCNHVFTNCCWWLNSSA